MREIPYLPPWVRFKRAGGKCTPSHVNTQVPPRAGWSLPTSTRRIRNMAITRIEPVLGGVSWQEIAIYFRTRCAFGVRFLGAFGLAALGLAILAFAATISYDCPIKSFN